MRAIGYYKSLTVDHDDFLQDVDIPMPAPGPRDLLVEVKAIAMNPVDTKVRMRAELEDGSPKILGYDASGVVAQIGTEVTLFSPGDEIFYAGDITRPGTNSEYHVVDERLVGGKPTSLSFADSAAIPLTAITAWELLFERFGVARSTEMAGNLLVIGGAGGVGSILTQFARQLTGLTVIATASRPVTRAWCEKMGAHHVIDHAKPLNDQVRALGIGGVDLTAALTHTGQHFDAVINVMNPCGKIGVIDDPGQLDIAGMKRKSISFHWEFMFTRSLFKMEDMDEQRKILDQVADLVDEGRIISTIGRSLGRINAANLKQAHIMQESGAMIGKTILEGF